MNRSRHSFAGEVVFLTQSAMESSPFMSSSRAPDLNLSYSPRSDGSCARLAAGKKQNNEMHAAQI